MGTTAEGIQIVSDGAKWTYAQASDQAYWPVNGELLDFYAYSPHENAAITAKTFATTRFNVELYRSSRRSQSSGLNVRCCHKPNKT